MFYVYILYSLSKEKYYVGQTNNIEDRLRRHNSGYSLSTKNGIPWELITSFSLSNRSEAMILEKKIKSTGAKRYLISVGFYEQQLRPVRTGRPQVRILPPRQRRIQK